MKRWIIFVSLFVMLAAVTACDHPQSPAGEASDSEAVRKVNGSGVGGSADPGSGSQPSSDRGARQTSFSDSAGQTSFSDSVRSVAFGEESEHESRLLLRWEHANLPRQPIRVVHHMEEVHVVVGFEEVDEQQLVELAGKMKVNGADAVFVRQESDGQYRLRLKQPENGSFELMLGDLPTITVERRAPLSFQILQPDGKEAETSLLVHAREYGTRLHVPLELPGITLQFPEPMKPALPAAPDSSPVSAEWADDRSLVLTFNDGGVEADGALLVYYDAAALEAVSGNRLFDVSLVVVRTPETVWTDGRTGNVRSSGPRDRHYEQLIVSPAGDRYIGVISLGGSMGDGDGWSYAFVLERNGQPPVLLEQAFYSTIEPEEAPIRWIDERRVLYGSYYGLFAFDTDTLVRRTLHDNRSDENYNLNFATWDSFRNKLYVIAYRNRSTSNETIAYTYSSVAWDDNTALQPTVTSGSFSETVLVNKYSLLDLYVHPTETGVYWTRTRDGLPYTEFVADDGTTQVSPGVARLVASGVAYMQLYKDGGQNIVPDGWLRWRPESDKVGEPMAMPPEYRRLFRSGDELIAEADEAAYRYDPQRNIWSLWRAPADEPHTVPVRGEAGLYRSTIR